MEPEDGGAVQDIDGLDALQAPDLLIFEPHELPDPLSVRRALDRKRPFPFRGHTHPITERPIVLARKEVLEVLRDLLRGPPADIKGHWTARVEPTGDRRVDQVRRVPPENRPRHRLADDWDRRHQRLRVRVLRISQHLLFLSHSMILPAYMTYTYSARY